MELNNRAIQIAHIAWQAAAVALLALALFTLATAASVRFAATSTWWWERGFERYDAPRRTGMTPDEVSRVGAEVRDYLRNDAERLTVQRRLADGRQAPVFSEREVVHMIDVKRLMARTWDAGWAAFGLIIALVVVLAAAAFWRGRQAGLAWLLRAAAAAGGLIVALVVVLAVVAVVGFDEAFRQFHLLFFTNDLWQLSSADALIQLFPQRFFFDTTLLIGAAIVIPAALLGVFGRALARRLEPA